MCGVALIDARYNASDIIRKLRAIGARSSQIVFYNLEATEFLNNVVSRLSVPKSFVNIDPPYVNKGPQLYRNSFMESHHRNLSAEIKKLQHSWILTYDECDLIHTLYSEYRQIPIRLRLHEPSDIMAPSQ